MSILTIILIVLLAILLFRVGFSILRFLISAALVVLCLYLAYQGILWVYENYQGLTDISIFNIKLEVTHLQVVNYIISQVLIDLTLSNIS